MRSKYVLIFTILLLSCSSQKEKNVSELIKPAPKEINFLINLEGDTIPTNIPILVVDNEVNPDSMAKPQKVPLKSAPIIESWKNNVFPVGEAEVIKIPSDLNVVTPGKNGVPFPKKVPAHGKEMYTTQPSSQPAMPLVFHQKASYDIQFLDVEQGLSSSFVWDILEDTKGHLWFGTGTNGIVRYTGREFTNYSVNEGLSHNTLRDIMEDSRGNLWFATDGGGVSRYDGNHFTHFTKEEGLNDNVVYSLLEDSRGLLWIGTISGLNRFDGKQFTHFTTSEGLSGNIVRVLFEDHQGRIWIGTFGGGVTCYDPDAEGGQGSFTHFTTREGLSDNSVRDIWEDKEGFLWFATARGVSWFDGTHFHHLTTKQGLSDDTVWAIWEDRWGDLWFGTQHGLNRYQRGIEGDYFIHFSIEDGLSNDWILSIQEDQQGNLWLGTRGGGVNRYDSRSFSYPKRNNNEEQDWIRSILEDRKGNLWMGTQNSGLIRYDGTSYSCYTAEQGLNSSSVSSIQEDKDGNLWIGMYGDGGVDRFDGHTFTHFGSAQGLVSDNIWSMLYDQQDNLWLGTWFDGATKYVPETGLFFDFTMKQGLGSNDVMGFMEDSQGNIWFGTRGGGVSRFDGKQLVNFNTEEGLGTQEVLYMMEDSRGYLWFGGEGVSRYDPEAEWNQFLTYTKEDGLSDNAVASILEDNDGNIWIGTQDGISVLKPTNNLLSGRVVSSYDIFSFGVGDGVKKTNFSQGDVCLDRQNRIWWGSVHGLTMLDLNRFEISTDTPEVRLSTIEIKENFIDFRRLQDTVYRKEFTFGKSLAASAESVVPFQNYPSNLVLPAKIDHLTFHFYAIDLAAPHRLKYSFMIEGLDDSWSAPRLEGRADYRSLPYGNYLFKVKAIGESKVWSDPFEYRFTILPPWWQTWWARMLYLLSGGLMISGYIRWRTYTLRRRQRQLEKTVLERTAEVVAEKDRSEALLLNILPAETAKELKKYGSAKAKSYDMVTVIFADFKDFTRHAELLSPAMLVARIDYCFKAFDQIMGQYQVEKIKTIGDAYMAAAGLPAPNTSNPVDAVNAALAMRNFMLQHQSLNKDTGEQSFEIRIGIHSGPVVAGIVGTKKFAYDIWGDTVNIAARMESSGEAGRVNISQTTYELLKDRHDFHFVPRGKIQAKNKGELEMYFVEPQ